MAPNDDIILGIDLGTTFSAMAIVDAHGKASVLPNGEGHATTPSVVHFYEPGSCVVGEEAVKIISVMPRAIRKTHSPFEMQIKSIFLIPMPPVTRRH